MTLAYEEVGDGLSFTRIELIDVMKIVDAGHNTARGMHGSWAGAMGHMQFMPSTFLA
jgi:membrane-bound lytic murein transglycosylase B